MNARAGRFAGRLALVTGASRGLGAAAAVALAVEGAELVLLARTVGGLEETDDAVRRAGGRATLVPIDLADFDGLDRLGAALHARGGKLDILIGAAAHLGTLTPVAQADPKDWERTMAVNATGHWRLLRSMDPLLRAAEAGRAVFVTDDVAMEAQPYWAAYAASKSALETVVRLYARECAKTRVRANLFVPGPMATRLRGHAFPGEASDRHPPPESAVPALLQLADARCERTGGRARIENGELRWS